MKKTTSSPNNQPKLKELKQIQNISGVRRQLNQAFEGVLVMPLKFVDIDLPEGITVLAIKDPQFVSVDKGKYTQALPHVSAFLEYLRIQTIDANSMLQVLDLSISQIFNQDQEQPIFMGIEQTMGEQIFFLVPTHYFYDHQHTASKIIRENFEKILNIYFTHCNNLIKILETFFEKRIKEIYPSFLCRNMAAAQLPRMSLLEFLKYESADPIEYFNYLFGVAEQEADLMALTRQIDKDINKFIYIDKDEHKKIYVNHFRGVKNILLESAKKIRLEHIPDKELFIKNIVKSVDDMDIDVKKTASKVGFTLDRHAINEIIEGMSIKEKCAVLLNQCANENFPCASFKNITEAPVVDEHLRVLQLALTIKYEYINPQKINCFWYKVTKENNEYQLVQSEKSLTIKEFREMLVNVKAAVKYLSAYIPTARAVYQSTELALSAYLEKQKKQQHEAEQLAMIAALNEQARITKEQHKAASSSSTLPSYQGVIAGPIRQSLTFMKGLITTACEDVCDLGRANSGVHFYLYFNPANFIHDIPDLSVFAGDSLFKIAAPHGQSGTKLLSLNPAVNIQCSVLGAIESKPIMGEMKPYGTEQRLFCVQYNADESSNRAVLLIPLIYRAQGLHTLASIESLTESSKNKVYPIHLPIAALDKELKASASFAYV
jgi:hypothetical protein